MSNNVVKEPMTGAFGAAIVANETPIARIQATYGMLDNVFTSLDIGGTSTATVVDNKFVANCGTAPEGFSAILTQRQLSYRAGQGAMCKTTAVFDTPAVNNIQSTGLITNENTLAFGYFSAGGSPPLFGIQYVFGGEAEYQELQITTFASGAETATVTVNSNAYSVSLTGIGSVEGDAFEVASSLTTQVLDYNFESVGGTVIAISDASMPGGLFAYSSGTSTGTWSQITAGKFPIFSPIPQASWNVNTMPGLDPLKGNVYKIQYQYGFGNIKFWIEDPDSGDFELVHVIKYANANTVPSVTNPSFRVGWISANLSGGTSSVSIQGGSAAAFIEGITAKDILPRSFANDQTGIPSGATLTNVLAVRNRIVFGGKRNRAEILLSSALFSTDTGKVAFFELLIDPVFSSPVTFSYLDSTNSLAETASDSVTVTGGRNIGTFTIVAGSSTLVQLNSTQVTAITPGVTIAVVARISSGAPSDCQASLTWHEDL